jgi:hypothetical protein
MIFLDTDVLELKVTIVTESGNRRGCRVGIIVRLYRIRPHRDRC